MIEIYYTDAYKLERVQQFDNLAGCITLPDYYPVTRILKDGQALNFQGTVGDLYRYFQTL